ncbi:MAG: hypothetical protein FWH18_06365, partial [Marinilabiliaceae bacterium]|nr:hypothetical protein [Marinilabiliaceae bacterium]
IIIYYFRRSTCLYYFNSYHCRPSTAGTNPAVKWFNNALTGKRYLPSKRIFFHFPLFGYL